MQRRIQADSVFRRRYSFVEKANLIAIVRTRMTEDRVSFSQAADSVGVPLSTLYKWQADLPLTPSTLQQDHHGPPSFIHDIEPQLFLFIYEWRERGMPVSRFSVVQKAIHLKPEFAMKTMRARMMCLFRFLHKYDLVHSVGTHTSQKPPEAAKDDARSYLQLVVPKCVGHTRSQDFSLNMDQTNNYFGVSLKSTVNVRGS